jgi:hypothetical protein
MAVVQVALVVVVVAAAILAMAVAVAVPADLQNLMAAVAPAVILVLADQDILHLKLPRLDKVVVVAAELMLPIMVAVAAAAALAYMVKAQMVYASVVTGHQGSAAQAAVMAVIVPPAAMEPFQAAQEADSVVALAAANQLQMKADYLVEQVAAAQ